MRRRVPVRCRRRGGNLGEPIFLFALRFKLCVAIGKAFRPKKSLEDARALAEFKDDFFKRRDERKGKPYDIHEAVISGVRDYAKNEGMLIRDRRARSGRFDAYGYFDYLPELKTRITALLEERGRTHEPVRLLDIGCGTGKFLMKLKRRYGRRLEVHGCDLSAKKFGIMGAKRVGVQFMRSEASLLPYDKNKFDIVFSVYGFEYFPDKLGALREMMRVAKEGSENGKGGEVMIHGEDLRKVMLDANDKPIDLSAELHKAGLNAKHTLSVGRGSSFMRNAEWPVGLRAKLRKMSLTAMRATSMDTRHHVLCIRKNKGDEGRLDNMRFGYAGADGYASIYRRKQPLRISAP